MPNKPRRLVVPSSLQMGWVESAPDFCAAFKTARDVSVEYIETKIGSLPAHKFEAWAGIENAPVNDTKALQDLRYILEVYVGDFISCIVLTSQKRIKHVTRGILHRIHDVFPPSLHNSMDPISTKNLCKGDGTYKTNKCLLGFAFDGVNKTIWLEEEKWAALLTILHQWIRGATKANQGVPFAEFKLVTAKLCHAFTALREGHGLLSPCN